MPADSLPTMAFSLDVVRDPPSLWGNMPDGPGGLSIRRVPGDAVEGASDDFLDFIGRASAGRWRGNARGDGPGGDPPPWYGGDAMSVSAEDVRARMGCFHTSPEMLLK